MMLLAVVLLQLWIQVLATPLKCRIMSISRQSGPGVSDQIDCTCKRSDPQYIGNLNFLKVHLATVRHYNRTVDVVVRGCDTLELDANFDEITDKIINLKIIEANSVNINNISPVPALEAQQTVIVHNCTHFLLTGQISCARCSQSQGPLHFQLRNISHVILENVNSTVPLKISGVHLISFSINQTYVSSLPWPGIFLFNASRVGITHSTFPDLDPKSISLTQGEEVTVSYNQMDVAVALYMVQYQHVNIRCNRRTAEELLPPECLASPTPEKKNEESSAEAVRPPPLPGSTTTPLPPEEAWNPRNDSVLWTVLAVTDVYGTAGLNLSLLLTVVFLLLLCCSVLCTRNRKGDSGEVSEAEKPSSFLGTRLVQDPSLGEEGDEYSNSSRAHLAQGVDGLHDPRQLRYVTVQGVRSEEGEGGIVCGSLTLGPTFNPRDGHSLRTVSTNRLKQQTFSKI